MRMSTCPSSLQPVLQFPHLYQQLTELLYIGFAPVLR